MLLGIIAIIYVVWSIRLGLQFVDGRWAALEEPGKKIPKIIISVVLGLTLGVVLIVLRILKFITDDFPRLFG